MNSSLEQQCSNFQVAIQVCDGGYIVHYLREQIDPPGSWDYSTSVFTDLETLGGFVKRVVKECEGPGDPKVAYGKDVGGMGIGS